MEEKNININGVECNYRVFGSGEDILILHGWGGNSDVWIKVQEELSKNGFRVFALDLPGFGKTKEPKVAWGVSDYKNFIVEFINKVNLNKFYLIGHSFGGRISIKLAKENEFLIKKLILCSPAGIKIKLGLKTSVILLSVEMGKIFLSVFRLGYIKEFFKKILYSFLKKRDYTKTSSIMKETMKKVISEDLTHFLKDIKMETLLIWGRNDRTIPLQYAEVFKREIKNSQLVVIEDSGHSPNKDNPLKLSEEINKFI